MKELKLLLVAFLMSTTVFSQDQTSGPKKEDKKEEQVEEKKEEKESKLDGFSISGYVQPEFQWGEADASLNVGSANNNTDQSFNRIGIRRGRVKLGYERGIASGIFQLDITEKGIRLKDLYVKVNDPWIGTSSLKVGVFYRTFGYEVSYSSALRESPEHTRMSHTLFPEESDLGAALTLQAPKTSPIGFLKLEAGLFAGNAINMDTDNKKDFIGHLSATEKIGEKIKWGLGVSYYHGSIYQGTENVYTMNEKTFDLNDNPENVGGFAKREYFGFDAQFSIKTFLGETKLTGEYIFGTQPGNDSDSKSPKSSTPAIVDTYIRSFNGGYAMLVQDLGVDFLAAVVKYDWYNPNTKVAGNAIGLNNTNKGDISYKTLGMGLLWRINKSLRLQAFYELIKNETSTNLVDYETERKDNVFTLRLQFTF